MVTFYGMINGRGFGPMFPVDARGGVARAAMAGGF
jgi:hypothetical protein